MSEEQFKEWLKREMPEGTVIGNPEWWAKKIWEAALSAKSVPDGWKLVPIELSHKQKQDMVWAYEEAMGGSRLPDGDGYDFEIVQKMHEAMLAAAPQAPTDDDRVRELMNKYNELIMTVASKFPNETRHETALRYIKNAEAPAIASMSDKGGE